MKRFPGLIGAPVPFKAMAENKRSIRNFLLTNCDELVINFESTSGRTFVAEADVVLGRPGERGHDKQE